MPLSDRELYAVEKLSQAVDELVTGAGRVQARLREAVLYLIRIEPDSLPDEEARRVFNGIKDDLAFDQPSGAEGRIAATLARTNDEDASTIARRILDLHNRLRDRMIREN